MNHYLMGDVFMVKILERLFHVKCRYWKACSLFDKGSEVCTKDAGNYYGMGRRAGCYREKERMLNESKKS